LCSRGAGQILFFGNPRLDLHDWDSRIGEVFVPII
jgi:hypothetical protein